MAGKAEKALHRWARQTIGIPPDDRFWETRRAAEDSPSTSTRLAAGLGPKRLPYTMSVIRPKKWFPRSRPRRDSTYLFRVASAEETVNSLYQKCNIETSDTAGLAQRPREGLHRCQTRPRVCGVCEQRSCPSKPWRCDPACFPDKNVLIWGEGETRFRRRVSRDRPKIFPANRDRSAFCG